METLTALKTSPQLARRITAARVKCGLSQEELSALLGFKDRQTLAAIEAGQRRVTAEELVMIADFTKQDLDFFTDPFRLVAEGKFSYRAAGTSAKALDAFEVKSGRWLALWRQLGISRGQSPNLLRPRLPIDINSSFEEAQIAGEAVGQELSLGEVPAKTLVPAIESKFHLLVLEVPMPAGVSGAAVQLASGDAILVNCAEPPPRKAFDLAHELFHVLTWDALPPERVDRKDPKGYHQKRTEQLADNFAAALLMPEKALKPHWEKLLPKTKSSSKEAMKVLAAHFHVSTAAVGWRLVALGWLKEADLPKDPPPNPSVKTKSVHPPLFSKRFIDRAVWGINHGELSVKRLLELLDIDLRQFRACCQAYGLKVDIGL